MAILRDISFLISMLHTIILFLILFKPRFSWRTTILGGVLGGGTLLGVNTLLMLHRGSGIIMSVAFFTCTIPTLLLFLLLSYYRDGRFFFLFCLSDTMCFWLLQITNLLDRAAGNDYVVMLISRLVLFPVAEYFLWRYVRKPFLALQDRLPKGWWEFAFVGAVYYLLIMFTAVPVDVPLPGAADLAVTFLVFTLMPLTYVTIFRSLWRQMQVFESTRQLELHRQSYGALRQKIELGRIYRHDMRHHLAALDGMLGQGDIAGARQYVDTLAGGLEQVSGASQCANAAVNAVLTAYLDQAGSAGCVVEARALLPKELPFEETDLCVLLANPLENAIHACQALPPDQRHILLHVEMTSNGRLTVTMENPCPEPVAFDDEGLPIRQKEEDGHGLGLRSVQAVANKYGGLFRCRWENGVFFLRAVLISPKMQPQKVPSHRTARITGGILSVLVFLIVLNCIPAFADALESIPILGRIIQVVDLRTYTLRWRGSEMTVREPAVTDGDKQAPTVSDANHISQDFIDRMREIFLWYTGQRAEGHTDMDVDYTVLFDTDTLLVLRFEAALNAGGSATFRRHVVLDKTMGVVLELKDLFPDGCDYVSLLSAEVVRQMEQAIDGEYVPYFLPGYGWPEESCFKAIDPQQDFFLDDAGQLVLVFEEYTIASGNMGTPEFVMPKEVFPGWG